MTEASTTSPGDNDRVECLDTLGSAIFPSSELEMACDLAVLLEPELAGRDIEGELLIRAIGSTTQQIEFTYSNAVRLSRPEDRFWPRRQRAVRAGLADNFSEGGSKYNAYFNVVRSAIHALSPGEVEYFGDLIVVQKQPVVDEHFVAAGQFTDPPEEPDTPEPRLRENTPENVILLDRISASFRRLLLLENHYLSTKTLDVPMAFGDRKQVGTATALLSRLRNIACDEGMGVLDKMGEQADANLEIGRLTKAVVGSRVDSATNRNANRRIYNMHTIFLSNIKASRVLSTLIYGRTFRLSGNRNFEGIDDELAEDARVVPEPAPSPVREAKKPEPEPKPDVLGEYMIRLQELEDSVSFPRFTLVPTKEIKRRKLDQAREVLVKGETDIHGNQVVGGRTKAETHRYISSIEFLRSFIPPSADIATAKEKLDEAVSDSSEHTNQLNALMTEAEDALSAKKLNELRDLTPPQPQIGKILAYIRNDWETASHVIRRYWPNGKQVAEQLRQLLFLSKEEIEAGEQQTTAA